MGVDDYDAHDRRTIVEYARDKVRARQWREDEAEAPARQTQSELPPLGNATPEHSLFVLVDAATGRRDGGTARRGCTWRDGPSRRMPA